MRQRNGLLPSDVQNTFLAMNELSLLNTLRPIRVVVRRQLGKNMKKKLGLLVAVLLSLSGAFTTAEAISLNIEVGDRGFYTHGAGYWNHGVHYCWIPGHWSRFRHHWIHGHYVIC